jgi:hypothetical protein
MREVYTECCWGNLKERDHLEEPDVYGRIILSGSSEAGCGSMS